MVNEKNELSFEQAYERLEKILEKLNTGNAPLEESLKLYEEADTLIQCCNKRLNAAEKKIEQLIKNRDGTPALDDQGNSFSSLSSF